jgi:NodT family efflux transporter outer membrane factor (OMF) lipoprotein
MRHQAAILSSPLPRFGAGEGGDPSRSDGEGEGFPSTGLEQPSPGRLRCASAALLSRFKAREGGKRAAALLLSLLVAACEVGPDYQKPPVDAPPAYKELDGWKQATPQEAGSNAAWWSIYDDPVLDGLMRQIDISNQNLKAAEAAYRESLALTAEARSNLFPTITASGSAQKLGQGSTSAQSAISVAGGLSWELDVWGAIRRSIESASANAQASGADIAGARLSAQASLATNYFELRVADELKRLLDTEVVAFERSLQITINRYNAGTAARTDVAQAETQLEQTRAQAISVGVSRAQFEHAIAVLIGKPPAELTITTVKFYMTPPPVPVGVPSQLLERRPDIAAAERTMASANAQIGVAVAAFYPTIDLTGSYGFTGVALNGLFSASNAIWAVGPSLAETVFDAGNRQAQVEQARATYDQDVALYRQTVLTAFQQVEDQLAALRILEQQAVVQDRAVAAAIEAERLTLNQYEAGTVDYTSVITAQTNSLNNQQTALNVMQSRILANVSLIEALGGGWTTAQIPPGG